MGAPLAVHLSLLWGDVVLRTACLAPPRDFALGQGGDWDVPREALGDARFTILRADVDRLELATPPAGTAWAADAELAPFRPAPSHSLRMGSRARIELGALSVRLQVTSAEPAFRPRARFALGALLHQGLSLGFHLGLLALLALVVPRMRSDEADAEQVADRVAFLLHALDGRAAPERERRSLVVADDDDPPPGQGGDGARAGGTGSRAPGEEGSPGSSASAERGGHVATRGPASNPDPSLARQTALSDASSLLGLRSFVAGAAPGAITSPWGRELGAATDSTSARAPLWGATLGDAFAWGGLGLTGTGEGGGGRAGVLGLGDVGALGRGAGTGTSAAFGPGDGLGGAGEGSGGRGEGIGIGGIGTIGTGGHRVRAPRVCGCDRTQVSGRLPPETIQRVVRASFGRFRACYEEGLRPCPSLQGRVVTRFVIARDGSVATAVDAGSDMDPRVVSCVVRAFGTLTFPEPVGGTVLVEYPLQLSPE